MVLLESIRRLPDCIAAPESSVTLAELLLDHPGLQALTAVWKNAAEANRLPSTSGIDPIALGRAGMLPFVWIIRGSSPEDYHLSLVGNEIRENYAYNPVDKPLRGVLTGKVGETFFDRICRVLEERLVHFSEGPVIGTAGRRYLGTRIMLPMIDDSASPGSTAILGGFVKSDETDANGSPDDWLTSPMYCLHREMLFDASTV